MDAPSIKYSLSEGKEDEFLIDEEYLAFKDGICYDVFKSKERYKNGLLVGHVRILFGEDGKPVAIAPPFLGFEEENIVLVYKKVMEYYEALAKRYRERQNKNVLDFEI